MGHVTIMASHYKTYYSERERDLILNEECEGHCGEVRHLMIIMRRWSNIKTTAVKCVILYIYIGMIMMKYNDTAVVIGLDSVALMLVQHFRPLAIIRSVLG